MALIQSIKVFKYKLLYIRKPICNKELQTLDQIMSNHLSTHIIIYIFNIHFILYKLTYTNNFYDTRLLLNAT